MESLADAGLTDVILSPGSRSTPFVAAACECPRLRLHDVVDERSAAFYALGRAKVTGRPPLLLCTSGSAAANYLPAVVEADAAAAPLLVLTADRPVELGHCGANQTLDQLKLYGDRVREFFDLGLADPSPGALAALRRTTSQAVFTSTWPVPGPVHLNARARKPLEPARPQTDHDLELVARVDRLLSRPLTRPWAPRSTPDPGAIAELARALAAEERGLILCGPGPIAQAPAFPALVELASRIGFPIVADTTSQFRFREGLYDGVLFFDGAGHVAAADGKGKWLQPELVVQIGRPATASIWERFFDPETEAPPRWVLTEHGWWDPPSSAEHLLYGETGEALEALVGALAELGVDRSADENPWLQRMRDLEVLSVNLVHDALEARGFSEGTVARLALRALPRSGLLALGNSLAVRMADDFASGQGAEGVVFSQRGVSGIDGITSGAAGAADASGRPTVLLTGDLSFLHDLPGLALLARLEVPFAAVVLQNRGGRIFERLPLAGHPIGQGEHFEHWTTPHELGFKDAASMFSLAYVLAENEDRLFRALEEATKRPGATVIEAVVPPHGAAELGRELQRRFEEALK